MKFQTFLPLVHTVILWGTVISMLLLDLRGLLNRKILKYFALGILIYLFAVAGAKSFIQWQAWSVSGTWTQNLLPPYEPFYFYFYVLSRFFLSVIFTAASAFLFGGILFGLERHSGALMISREEVWLGIVTALLAGWPASLLLIAFTFLCMILFSVIKNVLPHFRTSRKVQLAPFLFVALVAILLTDQELIRFFHLTVIKA